MDFLHFLKKRINELMNLFIMTVGLFLVFLNTPQEIYDLLKGIGVGFITSSIISAIISRYKDKVNEKILCDTIENKVGNCISAELEKYLPWLNITLRSNLADVYPSRMDALKAFTKYIDLEFQKAKNKEPSKLWISSCSLWWLINEVNGEELLSKAVKARCDLKILLTDPFASEIRSVEESHKNKFKISNDILQTLILLKRIKIKREAIRFYLSPPSIFCIATSDHMLINPYPNQTLGYRGLSIVVHKNIDYQEDIYSYYLANHFIKVMANHKSKLVPVFIWRVLGYKNSVKTERIWMKWLIRHRQRIIESIIKPLWDDQLETVAKAAVTKE